MVLVDAAVVAVLVAVLPVRGLRVGAAVGAGGAPVAPVLLLVVVGERGQGAHQGEG
jgi:hypothetical protein